MCHLSEINDLIIWIENHLSEPLTINQVANKAGYSKWHLQRMFFSVTGLNLGSYIRQRKLSETARALLNTKQSIIDIAIAFNFDSQQTFTRAFRKQFHSTPARYRRDSPLSDFGMKEPLTLAMVNQL